MSNIISIGGLGGSGTRIIAEIFIHLGYYMGDDLNKSNDNLVFTRLFTDTNWFKNTSEKEKIHRLKVFNSYLRNKKFPLSYLLEYVKTARANQHYKSGNYFYLKQLLNYINKPSNSNKIGWKEPNTQIFAPLLLQLFNDLKYIHVLRNGLDMGFSKNINQLKNWGYIFDIHLNGNESELELAKKQIAYWVNSTKRILSAKDLYKERIYFLNYDDLIINPKKSIIRLLDFLNLKISDNDVEQLSLLPKRPKSFNRHKLYDLEGFNKEHILFIQKMGFTYQTQ